jgi:peptidoglycan/xylan/chitin deacetylase (PgdA/CDA1 family)
MVARTALIGVVLLVAGGCAETPQRPAAPAPVAMAAAVPRAEPAHPLLARNDRFAVVVPGPGEDFATLAERYLGERSRAFEIADFNGLDKPSPGRAVAIPLAPLNPGGVGPASYQTVPILCYHQFGARASSMMITPASFEAQLRYLAQNGYTVIPLARLVAFLDGKAALPRKAVVITIDDGYRSTYEHAWPILKKYGFPATVFLYSDFVGASAALTWAQMKEMTAGGLIEIQPHSKTHSNLTVKHADESEARYRERIRREVDAPIDAIRERLGDPTLTYAYPYGDVNDAVIEFLRAKGVRLGATVTPGGNGFFAPPPMLRRSMIYGSDDLEAFRAKLVTTLPSGKP